MLFRLLLPMMLFLGLRIDAKSGDEEIYYKIESRYSAFLENDRRAMPFVRNNIATAKTNGNTRALLWAYEDAVFFTPEKKIKLRYADSILAVAKSTAKPDLIADAWLGRGIIYAFNFKNYRAALDDYIQAYQYSTLQKDAYLFHRIEYQIGVIKSYLGYDTEALVHFENALRYFQEKRSADIGSVSYFNHTRAYLNCLHQVSMIYRRQNKWKEAAVLCETGSSAIGRQRGFGQEQAYMDKERGIIDHLQGGNNRAIFWLRKALPELRRLQDAANFSVACYYMGHSYRALGNQKTAIFYFTKIDSVFSATGYLSPEIRSAYAMLINEARKNNNTQGVNFYTAQLMSADSSIIKNFAILPKKTFTDYDAATLRMENQRLLTRMDKEEWMADAAIMIGTTFGIGLVVIVMVRKRVGQSRVWSVFRTGKGNSETLNEEGHNKSGKKEQRPNVAHILAKLRDFERSKEFLKEDVNVTELARELGTNRSYLSSIINKHKHMSFPQYINSLRIVYITKRLTEDRIYRSYSVDALAKCCGIASRKTFAKHFRRINGIGPFEFINKIKKEQDKT